MLFFRNGYYLPGVAQVGGADAGVGGVGGSWHEPVGQTRHVTQHHAMAHAQHLLN